MELLKVFVGDAAISGAVNKNTMVKGDLLLLDATTHAVATGSSESVVVAAYNDKGVYVSAPISNANIKYIRYQTYTAPSEASATAVIDDAKIDAGATYTLGVQIKEDLRMGTYNKNTEILASHVCPAGAASSVLEVASTLAKGFAANPLTSAGSPYQLIKVVREAVAGTTMTALPNNPVVTQGSREVSCISHALNAGDIVNLGGNVYLVEGSRSTSLFTLDTAYQGPSTTLTAGTTAGASAAGEMTALQVGDVKFVFTAIAQTQQNRYDKFRMVDFEVITPKGNDEGIFTVVKTAPTYPTGTYRQIRDLEEQAYTNNMPLINYREFPFEVFPLNATSGTEYATLTVAYTSASGYNYMQSSQKEFLHTIVVAAPAASTSQFDSVLSPANASNFATTWNLWYTGTDPFSNLT